MGCRAAGEDRQALGLPVADDVAYRQDVEQLLEVGAMVLAVPSSDGRNCLAAKRLFFGFAATGENNSRHVL